MTDDLMLPEIQATPRQALPFDAEAYRVMCEIYLVEAQKDPDFEAKRLRTKIHEAVRL